ncbi:hypothetical protein MRX96_012447 [Rhipicephalus microplus]
MEGHISDRASVRTTAQNAVRPAASSGAWLSEEAFVCKYARTRRAGRRWPSVCCQAGIGDTPLPPMQLWHYGDCAGVTAAAAVEPSSRSLSSFVSLKLCALSGSLQVSTRACCAADVGVSVASLAGPSLHPSSRGVSVRARLGVS